MFSQDATSLLQGLLCRNVSLSSLKSLLHSCFCLQPKNRLGNLEDGIQDIKSHPFFATIDWHALEQKEITPPFVPKIESDLDLRNIDRMFTREMPRETPEDSMLL